MNHVPAITHLLHKRLVYDYWFSIFIKTTRIVQRTGKYSGSQLYVYVDVHSHIYTCVCVCVPTSKRQGCDRNTLLVADVRVEFECHGFWTGILNLGSRLLA